MVTYGKFPQISIFRGAGQHFRWRITDIVKRCSSHRRQCTVYGESMTPQQTYYWRIIGWPIFFTQVVKGENSPNISVRSCIKIYAWESIFYPGTRGRNDIVTGLWWKERSPFVLFITILSELRFYPGWDRYMCWHTFVSDRIRHNLVSWKSKTKKKTLKKPLQVVTKSSSTL